MFGLFKSREEKLILKTAKKALPIFTNDPTWVIFKRMAIEGGLFDFTVARNAEHAMAESLAEVSFNYFKEHGYTPGKAKSVQYANTIVDTTMKELDTPHNGAAIIGAMVIGMTRPKGRVTEDGTHIMDEPVFAT